MLLFNIGASCLQRSCKAIDDAREAVALRVKDNHYIKNRAIFHGLPIAIICSIAAGILFGSGAILPTMLISGLFGAFNYTVLTGLVEMASKGRSFEIEDKLRSFLMFCSAYTISHFVFNLLLNNRLTMWATLPLAIGAYAGNKARAYVN